jgi:hypothetical protein
LYAGNINALVGTSLWQFPIYQLSTGVYFVTATNESERFSQKIFIAQ